jgi:hypothetical protein
MNTRNSEADGDRRWKPAVLLGAALTVVVLGAA